MTTQIEVLLNAQLLNTAGLTALVINRIYPLVIPQDCLYPAIVYFKVSEIPAHAMGIDGTVLTARFQISVFASSYKSMKEVSVQVIAALSRYRDAVIQDILFENQTDLYVDEIGVYQNSIDFMVYYNA